MGDNPVESWKKQIQWYSENRYFKYLNRIDGQPMEFEWKMFPGLSTIRILKQIQQMMTELQCEPENFIGRIIFMSMFNDTVWDAKGNDESCVNNSKTIEKYARRLPRGHGSFLGSGSEKKWYGLQARWILESNCRENAADFRRNRSSGIPWHRALERGDFLEAKEEERHQYTSMAVHSILSCFSRLSSPSIRSISSEQLRICLKKYQWVRELRGNRCTRSTGETRNSYTTSSCRNASQWRATGKPAARIRATIWKIVRRPEVIQTMLRSRFEIFRSWTIILCFSVTKRKRKSIFMPRVYVASRSKRN